jgi:hypothetical protein
VRVLKLTDWNIMTVQSEDVQRWWNAYIKNDMSQTDLLMLSGNNENEPSPKTGTFHLQQGQAVLFPVICTLSPYHSNISDNDKRIYANGQNDISTSEIATINDVSISSNRVESGMFTLNVPNGVYRDLGRSAQEGGPDADFIYPPGDWRVDSVGFWIKIKFLGLGHKYNIVFRGSGPLGSSRFVTEGRYRIDT